MRQKADEQGLGDRYCITPVDEIGHQLLLKYLARRREELSHLKAASAAHDYDEIGRIGHNLAGSGAAYDLIRISTIGERMEVAAERRAMRRITECIAELEEFLGSITVADLP